MELNHQEKPETQRNPFNYPKKSLREHQNHEITKRYQENKPPCAPRKTTKKTRKEKTKNKILPPRKNFISSCWVTAAGTSCCYYGTSPVLWAITGPRHETEILKGPCKDFYIWCSFKYIHTQYIYIYHIYISYIYIIYIYILYIYLHVDET